MNRSGSVVPAILKRAKATLSDLVVVCDTLDLPAGVCRIKVRGSSGGHNGLQSVIDALGTTDFVRLYIGIGRPNNGDVITYVLGTPDSTESEIYASALDVASNAILSISAAGVQRVMNELNRRTISPRQKG